MGPNWQGHHGWRHWRKSRGKRPWGLQRRLTMAFVFVALAAVGLTTWFTLGAAFKAQRELGRLIYEARQERNDTPGFSSLPELSGPIIVMPDGTQFQPFDPRFDWRGPRFDELQGTRLDRARNAWRGLTSRSLLAALLAFGLASIAATVITRRITKPLRALSEGARRFAAGERGIRLKSSGRQDEISEVTDAFNALARNLEQQEAWRRALVADIAHDLRTPLSVMRSEIEAMQDGISQPDAPGLERLHGEVMLLSKLVGDLRTLSLAEGGGLNLKLERVTLEPFLQSLISRFAPRAQEKSVNISLAPITTGLTAQLDETQFTRVINNLLENALRHAGPGSVEITVMLEVNTLSITVRDHGPGLKPDDLERIFERFYQADASRTRDQAGSKGSGLGLAIARAIIEGHGGTIQANNHAQGGAVFTVTLPRA
jgi:two-component system, OmpR family, sensor histidine kinase BaeS